MDYAPLVQRIASEGAAAWDIHFEALSAQARGEDVVVLSVGDPDLDTPRAVIDRTVEALEAGDTHYTALVGEPALRQAIADDFKARGGWNAVPENVAVVAGAQTGLFFASLLLTQPRDEVVVPNPCYVSYEATVRASGADVVAVASKSDGSFRPDLDAIEAAITPRTRALFLANPNNPTGLVMTDAELEGLAEIARRHDLWVISDEVYAGLTFETSHTPISALPGMAERTVTVASLSKSHAMTGWRVGWMIGPQELIRHVGQMALIVVHGLPGFIQKGAITALAEAPAIVGEMRAVYRRRRDLVQSALGRLPGLRVVTPEAGMFLMVDVSGTGLSSVDFAWRLFREQGVSVLDGKAFGPGGNGYVRLSYTIADEDLEEACRRIASFVSGLTRATGT